MMRKNFKHLLSSQVVRIWQSYCRCDFALPWLAAIHSVAHAFSEKPMWFREMKIHILLAKTHCIHNYVLTL
jgi:hypothetical protein